MDAHQLGVLAIAALHSLGCARIDDVGRQTGASLHVAHHISVRRVRMFGTQR